MIFEFFLPLTNERTLRSTLDDLFYKDKIIRMLNKIRRDELYSAFEKRPTELENEYLERLTDWISKRFTGYSIGTVNGRFKTNDLKTFSEVGEMLSNGENYLIDETTAIVRFIFPIGQSDVRELKFDYINLDNNLQDNVTDDISLEINRIRFFFKALFVKSILDVVNGEDQIWMLESGLKEKLHILQKK